MADDDVKTPAGDGEDDDLANHPGAPRPRDEIDPELVRLSKPRVTVGPILSAAVIVFSGYLMVQLLPDFQFSRQDDSARTAGDVDKVANREGFGPEDYILVRANPDHAMAVRVSPAGRTDGHRLAPVQGTGHALWVMVGSEPWAEKPAYDEVYRGRLRDLDDLPFAGALRAYVRDAGAVPQSVSASALRDALEAGAGEVERPAGDRLRVDASAPVSVLETVADRAAIHAYLRKDRLPDHATWSAELARAGITAGAPVASDDQHIVYHVDGDPDTVARKISDASLYAARARPLIREHRTTWGELGADPAGLAVAGANVPWTSISSVVVRAPRAVPDDAMVLVTDESPAAYWFMLPLYVLLGLFVALFAWALVRSVMPEKAVSEAGKEAPSAA